jgi:3-dehydroquinate synthase
MKPIRIDVSSERGTYPVLVGPGLVRELPALLRARGVTEQRLVVTNRAIWRHHSRDAKGLLASGDGPLFLPDGERAKNLDTVARVYAACVERQLDRSAALLAFGGGVVGDITGFAGATYLRGIKTAQIPTTLLAQVDSAIGGKTGVNLRAGKNLVGSFYSPDLVVCDPLVLTTLSRREFRAGLYEVVKYGVIASSKLFTRVQRDLGLIFDRDPDVLTSIVASCCRIKADVVMSDERESGPRRVLNFGHTIGHALEAITKYGRFRHGEAIGYGMLAAAHLSVARGTMSADDRERLAAVLAAMGKCPSVSDLRASDALDVIARDKKVIAGRLHFVLAAGIGRTKIVSDVHTRELVLAMKAIGMRA